ncbi:MAG: hypothetical protein CMJ32_01600 [Phycisphaerae bacterium]|nr:hypothetical protein [Phycisphaerae bacterium]
MLTRLIKAMLPVGRRLARRMPRLANSAVGRASKAAVRELIYPTTQSTWRRSLPEPASKEQQESAVTQQEPTEKNRGSTVKKLFSDIVPKMTDPDSLADLKTPVISYHDDTECDVVMCCAFTGRHRLISQIIQESLSTDNVDVRWMLAGSTDEDEMFIRTLAESDNRIAGFTCQNRPLGRKWQTCVHAAVTHYESELYCIIGSDDIISRKLIESVMQRQRISKQSPGIEEFIPVLYCALEWLVWHTNSKSNLSPEIIRCSYQKKTAFQPLGAGRFYTREFLDSCNSRIFDSCLDRLLDDRGFELVLAQGGSVEYYSIEDGPLVSVKGEWGQLNSFSNFVTATTLVMDEYSFEGYSLLQRSLSQQTMDYLAKPSALDPQFNFSTISTGLENCTIPES